MAPFVPGLRRCRSLPAVALLAAACIAHAQGPSASTGRSAQPGARADPLDPQAPVPAVVVRSPLADYRRLGDDPPLPWRTANETVNRIGGWRAYARQAQQPDAAGPAAAAPGTPASAAAPARGHHHPQ